MEMQWNKYSQDNSKGKKGRFTYQILKLLKKIVIKIVILAQGYTNRPIKQSTQTDTHINKNNT